MSKNYGILILRAEGSDAWLELPNGTLWSGTREEAEREARVHNEWLTKEGAAQIHYSPRLRREREQSDV